MTFLNALHMLLGAGLLAFGVLAHAAWHAITRNARPSSTFEGDWEWKPSTAPARATVSRRPPPPAARSTNAVAAPVNDTAKCSPVAAARQNQRMRVIDASALEVAPSAPAAPSKKPQRSVSPSQVADPALAMAKDVAAVLVASGYSRAVATAAVNATRSLADTSIEAWTVAALRHCATA